MFWRMFFSSYELTSYSPPLRQDVPPPMEMPQSYPPHMRPRPISIDDEPERPTHNAWPYPPYTPSYREKDPIHGLPMQQMREAHDRPMSSMSGSSMHTMHSAQPMQPPATGPIGQAREALHLSSHYNSQRGTPAASPMGIAPSERSGGLAPARPDMLSGSLYDPSDPDLVKDRQICTQSFHIFNAQSHRSRINRMQIFGEAMDVCEASRYPNRKRAHLLGRDISVEQPFKCEYGYNIFIENLVKIESGCHISDPREVHVGKGSYIGPGVKIMGKVHSFQKGIRGFAVQGGKVRGFEIRIGEGVYIGANSVIQPDESECQDGILTIGDGAYIKPGSVVNKVRLFNALPNPLLTIL